MKSLRGIFLAGVIAVAASASGSAWSSPPNTRDLLFVMEGKCLQKKSISAAIDGFQDQLNASARMIHVMEAGEVDLVVVWNDQGQPLPRTFVVEPGMSCETRVKTVAWGLLNYLESINVKTPKGSDAEPPRIENVPKETSNDKMSDPPAADSKVPILAEKTNPKEPSPRHWIGVYYQAQVGLLPEPSNSASLAFTYRATYWLDFGLAAQASSKVRLPLAVNKSAVFSLYSGQVQLCAAADRDALRLRICACASFGAAIGEGLGFETNQNSVFPSFIAGAAANVLYHFPSVGSLQSGVSLFFDGFGHLYRPRPTYGPPAKRAEVSWPYVGGSLGVGPVIFF